MRYDKKKYVCFAGCLILTVLLLCGCKNESDLVITGGNAECSEAETSSLTEAYDSEGSLVPKEPSDSMQGQSAVSEDVQETPDTIYVQVTGAVRAPGVYELPAGSRVFEAIQKAGGMTDAAAGDSVNQAVEVSDGDMIVLYTSQEWAQIKSAQSDVTGNGDPAGAQQKDGRININTADMMQLCTIPGIGETRAQSIITYREKNGAFEAVEDIMKVSGIKDGLFQKIKDKITV